MDYFDIIGLVTAIVANVFIILGLFGNLLSFLVFSRKAFSKSSISIYCRALAVFDCFTAINLIFNTGSDTNGLGFLLSVKNNIGCKIYFFFSISLSAIPGWILVVFSADQIVNIYNTHRFRVVKQKWFQLAVVFFLVVFHVGVYSITLVNLRVIYQIIPGTNLTTPYCNFVTLPNSKLFVVIYLLESNIIPFIIMMFTTFYICRTLFVSTKKLTKFSKRPSKSILSQSRFKQKKFALNSVALNILFIILTSPLVIAFLFPSGNLIYDVIVQKILSLLFFLNYSSHFVTHFVINSVFRSQLFKMLRLKRIRFANNKQS